MIRMGESSTLADAVSDLTVSITDDRHPQYKQLCDDWNISNPEGYAKWFESRMKLAGQLLQERVVSFKAASIDDLPIYKWKTPLQRTVQLLKRHRDLMFQDAPKSKPISIIITTLAAKAYQGEADISQALQNGLSKMGSLVNSGKPRIPNPVDPNEDFADKWARPEYKHLKLEENFWLWLQQAQSDFQLLGSSQDTAYLTEQAKVKFAININPVELSRKLGLNTTPAPTVIPKQHIVTNEVAKPWRMED